MLQLINSHQDEFLRLLEAEEEEGEEGMADMLGAFNPGVCVCVCVYVLKGSSAKEGEEGMADMLGAFNPGVCVCVCVCAGC